VLSNYIEVPSEVPGAHTVALEGKRRFQIPSLPRTTRASKSLGNTA
jgi:hypothetical protein